MYVGGQQLNVKTKKQPRSLFMVSRTSLKMITTTLFATE